MLNLFGGVDFELNNIAISFESLDEGGVAMHTISMSLGMYWETHCNTPIGCSTLEVFEVPAEGRDLSTAAPAPEEVGKDVLFFFRSVIGEASRI